MSAVTLDDARAADLTAAMGRVRDAERVLDVSRLELVGLVRAARAAGWSQARVGQVLGVTQQRVSQMMVGQDARS